MFSVIFPGQGSQFIGMAKDFYDNFKYVRDYFSIADEILKKKLTKVIFEGPKDTLDLTENTQPAIFLVSYSIFNVIKKETKYKINDAKFFAGHSIGEYSALCCSKSINFEQTIELLKHRGKAMQDAVPKGEGGMIAILGSEIDEIHNLLKNNENNFKCFVANDNTKGQIVVSGKINQLNIFEEELNKLKIKYLRLPVSAPFHCPLMSNATNFMTGKIQDTKFNDPVTRIISNVTAKPQDKNEDIKKLLIEQIEKTVRWRESINYMINSGVQKFVEVGPGKVLSSLVKRIDRKVKLNQINNMEDLNILEND